MRSKREGTVSKPPLVRAFQGLVAKKSHPCLRSRRHSRGHHLRPATDHRGGASHNHVQLPNQTPPNPSPGRRSHLHRPGRHGVLGTATPPTLARADIACKVAYLPQLAVFRHGAPEPRRGVLFSRRVNVHEFSPDRASALPSRAGESGVRRTWPSRSGCANRTWRDVGGRLSMWGERVDPGQQSANHQGFAANREESSDVAVEVRTVPGPSRRRSRRCCRWPRPPSFRPGHGRSDRRVHAGAGVLGGARPRRSPFRSPGRRTRHEWCSTTRWPSRRSASR